MDFFNVVFNLLAAFFFSMAKFRLKAKFKNSKNKKIELSFEVFSHGK